ncbi:PepSY-associated TM helix domain-containing protein [Lysobacter gummosus]|uniref:PepSY domain-containing protein n=1 Tax=Lysobacter gummosus TaxID=262324 RepID=A0ABY3XG68_9GAMM|nr:PepSY-associated TM helix domain-containing protein [Lysobacter gummosus]ALN90054.1 pepSY-associated TM helix family protein [Lysobacter gummosus]UNP30627.1 PepSY domain-containing protein [Lysobacter gummosus]
MSASQASQRPKPCLRSALKWLHLWLGLSAGTVFAIVALAGTVLAFQRELALWAYPQLQRSAATTPEQRSRALARIVGHWQTQGMSSLDLPSPQFPVWQGYFPDNERRYFDPASGELLLTRNTDNDLVLWLRDLHIHLLSGKTGEAVLGVVGIIALFMLLSGLYLWWPRWSALAASLKWYRGPPTRRWFSWHRGIGLWLLPLTLLAVLTGVSMIYDDVARGALSTAFGDSTPAPKPPKLAARDAPIDWGGVLRAAEAATAKRAGLPGAQLRRISLPKPGSGLIALRARAVGEWHPVGRSMVWIDPYRGDVIGTLDATAQDRGVRAFDAIYPLHGGFVGGSAWQTLIALTGLLPGFLLVTGFLFWRRRRGR